MSNSLPSRVSHPWEPNLYFHVHEKCTIDNITLLGLSPRLSMCGFDRPAFALHTCVGSKYMQFVPTLTTKERPH